MRIILVRHGETDSNVAAVLDTYPPGAPLNALGVSQADALAEALEGEPTTTVYASSALRAQQTAEAIARPRGTSVTILDGLREIEGGALEHLGDRETLITYFRTALGWAQGDLQIRIPGGENGEEFFQRFDEAIGSIFRAGADTAIAVSHGASVRTWIAARCTNVDSSFARTNNIGNTEVLVVEGTSTTNCRLLSLSSRL